MIDTVVLMMEFNQFQIKQHNAFTPSTEQVMERPWLVQFGKEKVLKYRNNPTSKQKQVNYWPRLTLNVSPNKTGQGLSRVLRVEFSAPKMLFGNNFDELLDMQFGDVVRTLAIRMAAMGVIVTPESLSQSQVSAVHYSKNIVLTEHTRCSMVLEELSKLNVWKRLDMNSKDYRDGGYLLKWHANSYEICVYDKVVDLQKACTSPKRAFEADPDCQMHLFEQLNQQKIQALRLEIRLNTRRKIRSVLRALGAEDDVAFHMIFQKQLAAKVMRYYWGELMAQKSMASILEVNLTHPAQFLEAVLAANPTMTASKALQILGATMLMQKIGENGFKVIMAQYNPKTNARLIKDCKAYQPTIAPRWVAVRQVKQALEDFQAVRLENVVKVGG